MSELKGKFCVGVDIGGTEANAVMRALHHRMLVILPEEAFGPGLAGEEFRLGPAPEDLLAMHRVALRVNNPRNDNPECVVAFGTAQYRGPSPLRPRGHISPARDDGPIGVIGLSGAGYDSRSEAADMRDRADACTYTLRRTSR